MARRKTVVKSIDEQINELTLEIEQKKEQLKQLKDKKQNDEKEKLYEAMTKMNLNVEDAVKRIIEEQKSQQHMGSYVCC